MAKRPAAPPAPEPDETDTLLIELAATVVGDHFFDPDREQAYKALLSAKKAAGAGAVTLEEYAMDLADGECTVRLDALKAWTTFRVHFAGSGFDTAVEGTWSFEREELRPARVVARTGDSDVIESAAEELMDELEGPDLDDDEIRNMMEMLDDDEESPLIGDDPKEPPPAAVIERNRVKAIAKRMSRMPEPEAGPEDRAWMEQTPQVLPVVTDMYVAAAAAPEKKRDEKLIASYAHMLSLQLEFVRYRHDRGWEWATRMLGDYQQRLIALGESQQIPREDWFVMATALTQARVPVTDDVQTKLADAGFREEDQAAPEELMTALRGFLDDLARMVDSPFDVMETIKNSGALMPASLRGFMATELSLSPHPVLRDAVPLMLLDGDSEVRRGTAGALEQAAAADAMSPDALRRTIAVRNWIPPADRPQVDSAIRKARLGGVEIGAWPRSASDIEFHATMVDGSGAQSVLTVSRTGKKGLFGGLLLRHGTGVIDTWVAEDMTRSKITKMLKEAFLSAVFTRVDKPYVDLIVQHAIASGVAGGTMPPEGLLLCAERVGGAEWHDRQLDIAAEAERLFQALDDGDQTPEGIEALYVRGLKWMTDDPILSSWYEDGPNVRQALAKLPRGDRVGMIGVALNDILPPRRMEWAERFLLMAMWSQASLEAKYRNRARELIAVAYALTRDGPLGRIPVMGLIAMQTVREAVEGGW
jgi:hypothetical protein